MTHRKRVAHTKPAPPKPSAREPWTGPIPTGPMSVRLAVRILGETNAYGVIRLIAEGELVAQKVYNATGRYTLQVIGESVAAYLARHASATDRGDS
jgi:hypothetical protein